MKALPYAGQARGQKVTDRDGYQLDSSMKWWQTDFPKVVSLMEILRTYAEVYVSASQAIGMFTGANKQVIDDKVAPGLHEIFKRLQQECSRCDLLVTLDLLNVLVKFIESPKHWSCGEKFRLTDRLTELQSRLESELSHRLFFHLRSDRRKFFEEPTTGWQEVIDRFGDTLNDIEEMGRCFALSRYAAAVFHSTQVIELGLIQLGRRIGVEDPKSGWTAVSNKLEKIVLKTNHEGRTDFERSNFKFLEQVHGTIVGLKNAWRNKIGHVQNRIVLLTTEFTPDVCEEIMFASRAFMRRLATEMP